MKQLTKEHLAGFAAVNKRLGITDSEATEQQKHLKDLFAKKKDVVVSSDPGRSDLPLKTIPIASIAEFNSKVGLPDTDVDVYIQYPPAMKSHHSKLVESAASRPDLLSRLDEETIEHIKKAATAYVMGDSRKVKEWEPLINALMFPGHLSVFAGEDLNIPPGGTFTIEGPGPVSMNYQRVTVGKDGQIIVKTQTQFTSQIFIQE